MVEHENEVPALEQVSTPQKTVRWRKWLLLLLLVTVAAGLLLTVHLTGFPLANWLAHPQETFRHYQCRNNLLVLSEPAKRYLYEALERQNCYLNVERMAFMKYIPEVLNCPDDGYYKWDPDSYKDDRRRVFCTVHGWMDGGYPNEPSQGLRKTRIDRDK